MIRKSLTRIVLFLGIFIIIADVPPIDPNRQTDAARGCSSSRSNPEISNPKQVPEEPVPDPADNTT